MDKMDNPPTDIVLKASLSDAYGLPPPHAECRNNSYMLIVVMQIYVKDIIETKTNKKLHLPGTGTKQSEDIRQSSLFEKLHQLEGSVQEVFFSIKQASIPSYSTVDKNYLNGTPSP